MANHYRVIMTDRPDPIDVYVKFPDMVVAETEAPRNGIAGDVTQQPMALTLVWVWCAMRRQGDGVGTFPEFRAQLDDLETVREAHAVDPTQPAGHTPAP